MQNNIITHGINKANKDNILHHMRRSPGSTPQFSPSHSLEGLMYIIALNRKLSNPNKPMTPSTLKSFLSKGTAESQLSQETF